MHKHKYSSMGDFFCQPWDWGREVRSLKLDIQKLPSNYHCDLSVMIFYFQIPNLWIMTRKSMMLLFAGKQMAFSG